MKRIWTHVLATVAGAAVVWLVLERNRSGGSGLSFGRVADPGEAASGQGNGAAPVFAAPPTTSSNGGGPKASDEAAGEETLAEARALAQQKADEVAAKRREAGAAARGRSAAIGMDMSNVRKLAESEPIVQYLTYIQARRGDDSALLFIRYDDIDAMAELDGQPTEMFLQRLDQLGVVVSNN